MTDALRMPYLREVRIATLAPSPRPAMPAAITLAIVLAACLSTHPARSADTRLELPPIIVNAPEESEQVEPTPTPKPVEERVREALDPKPVGISETRGDGARDSVVKVRSSVMTYCLKQNLLARRNNIGDNVTVPTNCPN